MAEKNIGELPELTELDDLDQLVARSVGDVVTGRISIATLRAAMGGGSGDWSTHPATQDVDLDGHKLTGLGAPTEEDDAATKGYVDGAAPAKIELAGSIVEILPNGDIEIRHGATKVAEVVMVGSPNEPVFRLLAPHTSYPGHFYIKPGGDASLSVGGGWSGFTFGYKGDSILRSHNGNFPITSNEYRVLPSGVFSIVHGIHLAKQAYDRRADLEWWTPSWTPVENVDSVSNVECQYTRTHRAAGGSLVTLEGTIEVTPDASGQCSVQVNLPVARAGSGLLAGTAMAMEVTPPGHVVAVASVAETTLTLGFVAEGVDPYLVGFRASYRAA